MKAPPCTRGAPPPTPAMLCWGLKVGIQLQIVLVVGSQPAHCPPSVDEAVPGVAIPEDFSDKHKYQVPSKNVP